MRVFHHEVNIFSSDNEKKEDEKNTGKKDEERRYDRYSFLFVLGDNSQAVWKRDLG